MSMVNTWLRIDGIDGPVLETAALDGFDGLFVTEAALTEHPDTLIPVLEELHEDRAVYIIGFSRTRVTGDAETRRNIEALCTLDYYCIYAVTRKPSHYELCILYEDSHLRKSLFPRFLEREGLSSEKAASITD